MKDERGTSVELTVVGQDRKGVVASFTNLIFRHGGNIESVNQNVVGGLFGMHLGALFARKFEKSELTTEIHALGQQLGMDVGVHYQEKGRLMNLAVMVTRERPCPERILDAIKNGRLRAKAAVMIGSEDTLEDLASEHRLPFYTASGTDQNKREARILSVLQKYNIDIIALARYMRILSPNFVWRYPNKIINVHPSILPAFPGAYAYEQAYERGARIMGCTAHFVTMDLDEGPIIWQEAFRVSPIDSLKQIREKGQELEARSLVKALQLYVQDKLEVRWGRVHLK